CDEETMMVRNRTTQLEIPAQTREFAEGVVDEAEDAFHDYTMALRQAVATFGKQMGASQADLTSIGRTLVACFEKNLSVTFKFAHKILHARSIEEMAQLHTEFVVTQFETFVAQMAKLGQTISRAGVETATS